MPKPRKIDLNCFEKVDTLEDLENSTGIILIPQMLDDGTQFQETYWRRIGSSKQIHIENTDNITWFRDLRIATNGSPIDYAKRVDWWIKNALEDEEYKEFLNNMFDKHGFNIRLSLSKAITWLKTRTPSARKSYIRKFIESWLTKGLNWAIAREEKQ